MLTRRLPFQLPDFAAATPADYRAAFEEGMSGQLTALAALRDDPAPATVENVLGKSIDVVVAGRRTGDTAGAYASNDRALRLLGWVPTFTLEQGITDTARWLAVRPHLLNSV